MPVRSSRWRRWALLLGVAGLLFGLSACQNPAAQPEATPAVDSPSEDAAADPESDPATSDEGSGDAGPRSSSDEPAAEAVDLAAMDAEWPTEMLNGEAGPTKSTVLDAIRARDLPETLPLTEDFAGEDFAGRPLIETARESGIVILDWPPPSTSDLPGDRWAERFEAWLAEFAEIEHTEIHTWEIQQLDRPDVEAAIEVVEALWVVGTTPEGRRREDRLYLVFDLIKDPTLVEVADAEDQATTQESEEAASEPEDLGWRIAGVRSREGRTVIAEGRYFQDVTEQVLPGGYDQSGAEVYTAAGPALGDFDGDGDLDLFMPRMHAPMRLYANDGSGRFRDVTEDWGLLDRRSLEGSISGAFADVDQDGLRDLMVLFQGRGLRVYRNEGSAFRDITGPVDLAGPGQWQTLSVADVDGDGFPDAYLTNYNLIDTTHQPENYVDATDGLPNVLLRNTGDGGFEDATESLGLDVDNRRWTYASAFADYDADGDVDLYVANDYGPNHLFENDGEGRFRDVTEALSATDQANGMGVSWLDFDGDLDLDLYISNMQSFAGNRITRLEHFPGSGEQSALYRRFSQGSTLLRNDGDDGFTEWSEQAGVKAAFWAWGAAPFDYDADGDEDIFSAAGFYTGPNAADT